MIPCCSGAPCADSVKPRLMEAMHLALRSNKAAFAQRAAWPLMSLQLCLEKRVWGAAGASGTD